MRGSPLSSGCCLSRWLNSFEMYRGSTLKPILMHPSIPLLLQVVNMKNPKWSISEGEFTTRYPMLESLKKLTAWETIWHCPSSHFQVFATVIAGFKKLIQTTNSSWWAFGGSSHYFHWIFWSNNLPLALPFRCFGMTICKQTGQKIYNQNSIVQNHKGF